MMELLAATAVADQDISIIKQLASMKQFCNWLEAQPVTVYSNLVSSEFRKEIYVSCRNPDRTIPVAAQTFNPTFVPQ